MRTTRQTLDIAWDRIHAMRELPEHGFWEQFEIIEQEVIEAHPEEERALRQFLASYAYRAMKPNMDSLPRALRDSHCVFPSLQPDQLPIH